MGKKLFIMILFSFVSTVCTFSFQTLATHILLPKDYGTLALWLTDLGYLSMFFVLGLDSSILYHAKLGEKFQENMGKNFIIYTLLLLLFCFIIFILDFNINYYIPLFISISAFAFINIFKAYFQFIENYFWFNILSVISPLSLVIYFGIIVLLNIPISINDVLHTYSIISFFALFIVCVKYFTVSNLRFSINNIKNFSYFTYGIKSILNKILSLSLYACTIYAISILGNAETTAYFFVASGISKLSWVVPDSVGNILFPKFLKIGNEYKKEDIFSEMYKYAQLTLIFNIIAILVFFVFGKYILGFLYNNSYQGIFYPIMILLIGNQGMVFYKIISRYMSSLNQWRPLYFSLAAGIVSNLLLNIILLPKFQLLGASIATALSFWVCGIVISSYVNNSFLNFLNFTNLIKKNSY